MQLHASAARTLRIIGPVELCPDRARGVIAVDAPLGSEGADDLKSMRPGGITGERVPGATVVLDGNPRLVA
jgi:hypothetical protein